MEAVKLADEYLGELFDGAKEIGSRILAVFKEVAAKREMYQNAIMSRAQPQLQKMRELQESMIDSLHDKTPISQTFDVADQLRTFVWGAMIVWAAGAGNWLEGVLHPLAGLFLTKLYSSAVAFVVMPFLMLFSADSPQGADLAEHTTSNDAEKYRRHRLLGLACVQGFNTGFFLRDMALACPTPSPAFTPLAIGLGAFFVCDFIERNRVKLLGVTLGAGFALHMLVGVIRGLSLPYLLLSCLYTASGYVVLQMYISLREGNPVIVHFTQLLYLYLVLASQFLACLVFNKRPEEIEATETEAV